jgi:hypothetical protein
VVVALGRGALQFLLKYRQIIGSHIPIVYCNAAASVASAMNLPRDIVGVTSEFDWPKTLALAAQLQPNARNLVFISGASDYDKQFEKDALRDLAPHSGRYNVRHLSGLPYDRLRRSYASKCCAVRLPSSTRGCRALARSGSPLRSLSPTSLRRG